ncbi:hypothetical protein D3C77_630510 [compost metagenome]
MLASGSLLLISTVTGLPRCKRTAGPSNAPLIPQVRVATLGNQFISPVCSANAIFPCASGVKIGGIGKAGRSAAQAARLHNGKALAAPIAAVSLIKSRRNIAGSLFSVIESLRSAA